jgi:hypothetical protein
LFEMAAELFGGEIGTAVEDDHEFEHGDLRLLAAESSTTEATKVHEGNPPCYSVSSVVSSFRGYGSI